MSTKAIVMVCCTVGMAIGGGVPWVLGDHDILSVWPVLGGFVGAVVGIWIGVKASKQLNS